MRELDSATCNHTARQAAQHRSGWSDLLEVVLEVHDLDNGLVLDLPAYRYEDIVDVVERERECCGNRLNLSLDRKEGMILLTATSEEPDGASEIRSMLGLAS